MPGEKRPGGGVRLPGGPGVWLGGGALLVSLITLVLVLTSSGGHGAGHDDAAGAGGTAGAGRGHGSAVVTTPPSVPDIIGTDAGTGAGTDAGPGTGPSAGPAGDAAVPPGTGGPVPTARVTCPAPTVTVTDAATLANALATARPGDSIRLADGVYEGRFTATAAAAGTAQAPVFVCGGPGAVLDGGGIKGGYGFHLDGASYWRLVGFTVRDAQKGVVADGVRGAVLQGLTVEQIGDEAIHLRDFSSDNLVRDNTVRTTGLRRDKFGEGVYIGSAKSNWCTDSGCKPDASDRNVVLANHISDTTAEAVDIKEGTTGGRLIGNTFDGSKLTGGTNDSWVDVKGNDWLIEGNTGRHSPQDGFQTHRILHGWGTGNTFTNNTAQVDGPGWGFHLTSDGNVVACDNKATGGAKGLSNVTCTP